MLSLSALLGALGWAGTAVFAMAGALTASRKQLDPIGFVLIACVTAFGGGTIRDLVLDRTVFWLDEPALVLMASAVALVVFFTAHWVERRFVLLLWADAVGMALFAVVGAEAAYSHTGNAWIAILMGTITATFGGLLRDMICAELPLLLRKEIYATAAAAGAALFVVMTALGLPNTVAVCAGMCLAFAIRAAALVRGWSLPAYTARTN
ncbi:trimeric intracellular cation channel family protein [Roseomonas aerophila]|uniref:Trimeric intracellular cation channel family protein n=1 Tax=Teichococcus aerophilus TaxID=1224513 RepID=A0ABR7RKC1_9PROT|nr:trimeric intracellular cation channel family protein [Pseudoroseomonas aerophila]MBC9207021.1 trimeric intracellular cation channel family protein [Pseudoroseomonas aerophila]